MCLKGEHKRGQYSRTNCGRCCSGLGGKALVWSDPIGSAEAQAFLKDDFGGFEGAFGPCLRGGVGFPATVTGNVIDRMGHIVDQDPGLEASIPQVNGAAIGIVGPVGVGRLKRDREGTGHCA